MKILAWAIIFIIGLHVVFDIFDLIFRHRGTATGEVRRRRAAG